MTCIFTYAAAGGTNEVLLYGFSRAKLDFPFVQEWTMNLRKSKKHTYVCTVER